MITFLTEDQLAARLHVSKRTIQRWANTNKIPYVDIGRTRLFTETQVEEIAKAYTVEVAEPVVEHTIPNPRYASAQRPVVVPMRRPTDAA